MKKKRVTVTLDPPWELFGKSVDEEENFHRFLNIEVELNDETDEKIFRWFIEKNDDNVSCYIFDDLE